MWSSSIRKASWNWKKVAVLTLCFMLLNDNHRYRGNKGSWWNRPHAGRWTIARRVVRVFYMCIIYNFTEVQVSRVIIVLLLQNCYSWCSSINWVERSTKYVLLKKRIYIIYIYIYIYILKTMKNESLLCFCATRFTAVAALQA